jgi:hypothetical protein
MIRTGYLQMHLNLSSMILVIEGQTAGSAVSSFRLASVFLW